LAELISSLLKSTLNVPILFWPDVEVAVSNVLPAKTKDITKAAISTIGKLENFGRLSYFPGVYFSWSWLFDLFLGVENGRRRKSRVAENVEKPDFGFIILDIQWLVFLASSIIQSENKKYLKSMQLSYCFGICFGIGFGGFFL
jgi:hypothetical protein